MTVQTLRDMLTAVPFQSFKIAMSSGQSYEVRHPEMALLTRTNILIGTGVEDGIPDAFKICSLLHLTSVEPIEPASAGPR